MLALRDDSGGMSLSGGHDGNCPTSIEDGRCGLPSVPLISELVRDRGGVEVGSSKVLSIASGPGSAEASAVLGRGEPGVMPAKGYGLLEND